MNEQRLGAIWGGGEIRRDWLVAVGGLLFVGFSFCIFGQEKTAPVSLHNLSLHFFQAGNGVLERTFSAGQYRGRQGSRAINGTELRPRLEEPGVYEANYIVSESGVRVEYGTIVFHIPSIDSDSNGVPDIVQQDKSFDAAVTGVLTPIFIANERITLPEFMGSISRAANNSLGDYSFNIYADGGAAVSSFKILNGSGAITYERGERNTIILNTDETSGIRLIANTSFKIANENEIVLRAFAGRLNDGKRVFYPRLILRREGNRYIGVRTLRDGNRETPGRDFRHSLIQMVDVHDADSDGVPDLSDLDNTRPSYNGNVLTWGYLLDGLIDVPIAATNVTAIAAGGGHSLALRADGKVFSWGRNDLGQAAVPVTATNIESIAAGTFHSLAARADGTVVGWGLNASGQTMTQTFSTGVVALAAGTYHSLALTRDGRIHMWGYAGLQGFPIVPFAATNITAIAADSHHNIALRADGTVVTWGVVYNGSSYGPATPPPGLNDLKMIAAGQDYGLGLKSNGTVVAWGYMYDGTTGQHRPASVPENLSNVVSIAAGTYHSLAITSDGNVVSWGWDNLGNLRVPAFVTNAIAVAVGDVHSLAITAR